MSTNSESIYLLFLKFDPMHNAAYMFIKSETYIKELCYLKLVDLLPFPVVLVWNTMKREKGSLLENGSRHMNVPKDLYGLQI